MTLISTAYTHTCKIYPAGGQTSGARALRVAVKPHLQRKDAGRKDAANFIKGKYLTLVEARKALALEFFVTSN